MRTCADAAVRNASAGCPPSQSSFFQVGTFPMALAGVPAAGTLSSSPTSSYTSTSASARARAAGRQNRQQECQCA